MQTSVRSQKMYDKMLLLSVLLSERTMNLLKFECRSDAVLSEQLI